MIWHGTGTCRKYINKFHVYLLAIQVGRANKLHRLHVSEIVVDVMHILDHKLRVILIFLNIINKRFSLFEMLVGLWPDDKCSKTLC